MGYELSVPEASPLERPLRVGVAVRVAGAGVDGGRGRRTRTDPLLPAEASGRAGLGFDSALLVRIPDRRRSMPALVPWVWKLKAPASMGPVARCDGARISLL